MGARNEELRKVHTQTCITNKAAWGEAQEGKHEFDLQVCHLNSSM